MGNSQAVAHSVEILLWMTVPIVAGFTGWHLWLKRKDWGERVAGKTARFLSKTAILGAGMPMMLLIFWKAELPLGTALVLPAVGLFGHVIGGAAGWGLSRAAGYSPQRQASCFLSGTCSNILTLGGICAVILLNTPEDPSGEIPLGQMAIYRVFEAPYYFLLAWPAAAMIAASGDPGSPGWGATLRRALRPVTLVPVAGIVVGLLLNLFGPERPGFLDGVATVFVKINVVLLGVMVGLTLRSARPIRNLRACLMISGVKFLIVPAATVALAWTLGFDVLTLQVVLISTTMPVAFMALVGANLFGLEEELVSSLWFFTTIAMAAVVPALAFVVPLLGA